MTDDLAYLDATAQSELVRSGQLKPRELIQAAIDRVQALNPAINAVVTPLFDRALDAADDPGLLERPFGGVPILLKDQMGGAAGDPMYEGMRALKEHGWREPQDSHVVTALKAAGFVVIGKSNLPELALNITTEPAAQGPTRNPWDLQRSPGGSSGGSAAGVAAGMVPLAHGTDAGGSLRIPASMCGVVGLKPTRGRTSQGPDLGDVWQNGSWHVHGITRSVRDTAALLDVLNGYRAGDPFACGPPTRPFAAEVGEPPGRLRVGVMARTPDGFPELHPDCVTAVRSVADRLTELGHEVDDSCPRALDTVATGGGMDGFLGMAGAGVEWMLQRWSRLIGRSLGPDDVEPYTWAFATMGREFTGVALIQAIEDLIATSRQITSWWDEGYDILLTPTIAVPPFPLGTLDSPPDDPLQSLATATALAPFTAPWNMTGQPAVSLPLHWNDDGLPIGVQFVAEFGHDAALLRLAAQLERAMPWATRRPPHGA